MTEKLLFLGGGEGDFYLADKGEQFTFLICGAFSSCVPQWANIEACTIVRDFLLHMLHLMESMTFATKRSVIKTAKNYSSFEKFASQETNA